MSKVPMALEELHRAENHLAADLLKISDRHKADHEVHHVARDIARWSQIHAQRLAVAGHQHGVRLNPAPRWEVPVVADFAQRAGTALRKRPEPGLLLLADLRRVHRKAAGVSLDWELLAQAAQAMRQRDQITTRESPAFVALRAEAARLLRTRSPGARSPSGGRSPSA